MEKNEIKKGLYKENPKASLEFIRKGIAYYFTVLNENKITFEIPISV